MAKQNVGEKAINFSLVGVDDKKHSINDYANKYLAVIFSCNHCPYVRAWEDRMIGMQTDYASNSLQLIVINANDAVKSPDDDFPKMKERARQKRFNFPYLYDEDQKVAKSYGAERTPEVFLFDKQLILRYHGSIDDNYDDPTAVKVHYLRNALDALVNGGKIAPAETKPVGCTIKWR